jgi:ketosteroid isomerase-like protein
VSAAATGVVEQMLGHAAAGRWEALHDVLDERFTIVEPESLPYGGTHRGVDGYVALLQQIAGLFELAFEPKALHALADGTVVLRMDVTFTARSTGERVQLPVVELLEVTGGRVRRSEVFVSDTAALLNTLTVHPTA